MQDNCCKLTFFVKCLQTVGVKEGKEAKKKSSKGSIQSECLLLYSRGDIPTFFEKRREKYKLSSMPILKHIWFIFMSVSLSSLHAHCIFSWLK